MDLTQGTSSSRPLELWRDLDPDRNFLVRAKMDLNWNTGCSDELWGSLDLDSDYISWGLQCYRSSKVKQRDWVS